MACGQGESRRRASQPDSRQGETTAECLWCLYWDVSVIVRHKCSRVIQGIEFCRENSSQMIAVTLSGALTTTTNTIAGQQTLEDVDKVDCGSPTWTVLHTTLDLEV